MNLRLKEIKNKNKFMAIQSKFSLVFFYPFFSFFFIKMQGGLIYIIDMRNDICTTILQQLSLSYSHYVFILSLPFSLYIIFDQ